MAGARLAGGALLRQPLLDRVEPAADRAQLGVHLLDVVGGRGACPRAPPRWRPRRAAPAPRRPPRGRRARPARPSGSARRSPSVASTVRSTASRRLSAGLAIGAGGYRRRGRAPRRPLLSAARVPRARGPPESPSADRRAAERVLLPGDPARALRGGAGPPRAGAADVQSRARTMGLHRHRRRRRAAHGPGDGHGRAERGDRLRGADRARRERRSSGSGPAARSTRSSSSATLLAAEAVLPADGTSAALGAGGAARAGPGPARPARGRRGAAGHGREQRPVLRPARGRGRGVGRRGAVAVEMEAATIFQVAARRGVPAACVLGVSDVTGHERQPAHEPGRARGARRADRRGRLRRGSGVGDGEPLLRARHGLAARSEQRRQRAMSRVISSSRASIRAEPVVAGAGGRAATRSSMRSIASSIPSSRWETERSRRVTRSMSAADGRLSAPIAASCAWTAFSRASKARAIAALMTGLEISSSAILPSASSPWRESRSTKLWSCSGVAIARQGTSRTEPRRRLSRERTLRLNLSFICVW